MSEVLDWDQIQVSVTVKFFLAQVHPVPSKNWEGFYLYVIIYWNIITPVLIILFSVVAWLHVVTYNSMSI